MKALAPNLMVNDVRETTSFYIEVLGFHLIDQVSSKGRWQWALVKRGGVSIMFQDRANLIEEYPLFEDREQGQASLTLYIRVIDALALRQQVGEAATIVKDVHKTFYGSTDFTIADNNGYILVFSEEA
jgi:uncharacterized glyoxalase superfamily protein PhnB